MMMVNFLIYFGIICFINEFHIAKGYIRNPGNSVIQKRGIQAEPTCEELKAMWRFSKRQSRAAELSNELPMYQDPFVFSNTWPYHYHARLRNGGGKLRNHSTIYGTVRYDPEKLASFLMPAAGTSTPDFRRPASFRVSGGRRRYQHSGAFDELKEIVATERARELQQQRLVEESAARAAAIRDMGRNQPGRYTTDQLTYKMNPPPPQETMYASDVTADREEEIPDEDNANFQQRPRAILPFPDLLAPGSRLESDGHARFVSDFTPYPRIASTGLRYFNPHSPNPFDPDLFRVSRKNDYTGYFF